MNSIPTDRAPYLTFQTDDANRVVDVVIGEGWTLTDAAKALVEAVEELLKSRNVAGGDDQQQS